MEEQSTGYADAPLKWGSAEPRPFVYESTGALTRFTDRRDPKPRSREVFSFHRPDTMQEWRMFSILKGEEMAAAEETMTGGSVARRAAGATRGGLSFLEAQRCDPDAVVC